MFCPNCGAETPNNAAFCMYCGAPVTGAWGNAPGYRPIVRDETMCTITKVFLIIGCIAQGWLLLPLAWCIPMTVSIFNKLKYGEPIGTGLKVCTLLFVSLISGILLLCMGDD